MSPVKWSARTESGTTTYIGESELGEFVITSGNGVCEVLLPKCPWDTKQPKRSAESSLEAMVLIESLHEAFSKRQKEFLGNTNKDEPIGLFHRS